LYVRGELKPVDEWSVAVVGTRRATAYGRDCARMIVGGLLESGVTAVSGLAYGIDTEAHRTAVNAGGRTIAVLGSGVDIIYLTENRILGESIIENGAIVSEYPLGTNPEGGNCPWRNRIISGLSLGVLVVEGAIQNGAKLVAHVNDTLEELNLTMIAHQSEARAVIPGNEVEAVLLEQLSSDPVHVDELREATGLSAPEVSSALTMMELKGKVRQVEGMNYVIARESDAKYIVE
jgi:DNA processing protein